MAKTKKKHMSIDRSDGIDADSTEKTKIEIDKRYCWEEKNDIF